VRPVQQAEGTEVRREESFYGGHRIILPLCFRLPWRSNAEGAPDITKKWLSPGEYA
jgi:hypothetical protein